MPHEYCIVCPERRRIPSSEKKRIYGIGYICKKCHWKVVNGHELYELSFGPTINDQNSESLYDSVSSVDMDEYDSQVNNNHNSDMSLDQVSSMDMDFYDSVVPDTDSTPAPTNFDEMLFDSSQNSSLQMVSSAGTMELEIRSCSKTERCCFLCKSIRGRSKIPKSAIVDVWFTLQLFIPSSNRCCPTHLDQNNLFTEESKQYLVADKTQTKLTPSEIKSFILDLTSAYNQKSSSLSFERSSTLKSEDYELLTGLTLEQFHDTLGYCMHRLKNTCTRSPSTALAIFLMKLRLNLSQDVLAFFFHIKCQARVSEIISTMAKILEEEFVPKFLGYGHITREEFIKNHNCSFAHILLGTSPNSANAVLDATYLYIQKSSDFELQRRTYSAHKHRNLLKPMIISGTDGYVLEVEGLYFADAANNDAAILNSIAKNETGFSRFFREKDDLIVDRGFRDSLHMVKMKNYNLFMPRLLKKGQKQFETADANESRRVTMVRWVIESVNGRFKNKFKFFADVVPNSYIPKLRTFLRIAIALINCYSPPLFNDTPENHKLAEEALRKMTLPNLLEQRILESNLQNKRTIWIKITEQDPSDFPHLTLDDLKFITLGSYQIKMSAFYTRQHKNESYEFFHHKDDDGLIRAKIQSRFQHKKVHQVWIEFEKEKEGRDAISQWYCSCKTGSRVAGCCSHVSSVIWYLGYQRHQPVSNSSHNQLINSVLDATPFQFDILSSDDEDEDEEDFE